MKISIFGSGYVGLVSGVCLADNGHKVFCIDNDEAKIEKIRNGISPIFEPGLSELLGKNRDRIFATTDAKHAIQNSNIIIIAVGTPFDGREIDLRYIKDAAKEIGQSLRETEDYKTIVVKSTVTPGTTKDLVMQTVLHESRKGKDEIGFCMNPEFLREGSAVNDFKFPDRIVLGVTSEKVEKTMRKVYAAFSNCDIFVTNLTTAEMIKYTANSLLALNISYANEIARICEKLENVDSEEVFHGVILDRRISPITRSRRIVPDLVTYLRAGCGFGGSCFPKDVKALLAFEGKLGVKGALLEALLSINEGQIEHVFNYGISSFRGRVEHIAILGTAFKPNTDDVRESPGIKLAKIALKNKLKVSIHDYIALDNTRQMLGNRVTYHENPITAIKDADVIFLTTIWDMYSEISDEVFEKLMKKNGVLIDCRSFYKDRKEKSWRKRIGFNQEELR